MSMPNQNITPGRSRTLPFDCTPDKNMRMRNRYAASTVNKYPKEQLPGMTNPEIRDHVNPEATPVAVYTPATVTVYWQEEVEKQLNDDISLES